MTHRASQAVLLCLLVLLAAGDSAFAACPNEEFQKIAGEIAAGQFNCQFPEVPDRGEHPNVCKKKEDAIACVRPVEGPIASQAGSCVDQQGQARCKELAACLGRLSDALKKGQQSSAESALATSLFRTLKDRGVPFPDPPATPGQLLQPLIKWLETPPEPPGQQEVLQSSGSPRLEKDLRQAEANIRTLSREQAELLGKLSELEKRRDAPPSSGFYLMVVIVAVATTLLTLLALRRMKDSRPVPEAANLDLPKAPESAANDKRGPRIEPSWTSELTTRVREEVEKQIGALPNKREERQEGQRNSVESVRKLLEERLKPILDDQDSTNRRLQSRIKALEENPLLGNDPWDPIPGPPPPPHRPAPGSRHIVPAPPPPPPQVGPDDLVLSTLSRSLEEKLLKTWQSFLKREQVDFILSAFEVARSAEVMVPPADGGADQRQTLNTLLVKDLNEAIGEHPSVRPAYRLARSPFENWWAFSIRLSGVRDMVSGPKTPVASPHSTSTGTKAQGQAHLFRVWDGLQLLAATDFSDLADRLAAFSLKGWLRTDFLRFADVLMLERGRSRGDQLNRAYTLTRVALGWAGVVPIDIRLGQDRFDSNRHIAKAADTQTHLPDGAILSVVRNGFLEVGAAGEVKGILQRPEVIVNRV